MTIAQAVEKIDRRSVLTVFKGGDNGDIRYRSVTHRNPGSRWEGYPTTNKEAPDKKEGVTGLRETCGAEGRAEP